MPWAPGPCSVDECPNPRRAFYEMCSTHVSRWYRLGSTELPVRVPKPKPPPRVRPSFEERFHRGYTPQGDGCWEWQRARDKDGYGLIQWGRKQWRAPRASFTLAFGRIPEGLEVRHKCDNPPCVRPDHLELGTRRENKQDSVVQARHAIGKRNGNAKLTEAQVLDMRARYAAGGITQTQLAIEFGVSIALVSFIITRKAWAHI